MNPEEIGWKGENMVLGKHSGKHAIDSLLKERGYELTETQIDEVIKKTKELADHKKTIMNEDVIAIAIDLIGDIDKKKQIIRLDEVKISTGNKVSPEAFVSLEINNEKKSAKATGIGPVDAVKNAIEEIIGDSIKLKDYHLKAITRGTNALADVEIKVQDKDGNIFHAQSVNEDIVMASALALIEGINKALNFRN
jgi:2-isopropylmalate synthase